MMKLSGWKHRLEAFAATRRKAVETQSSHRREGAGRHKNTPGPPVNGENISLDVPFYRTLSTRLGNPAKNKSAGFPHFHRAGGGFISSLKNKNEPENKFQLTDLGQFKHDKNASVASLRS